MTTVAAVCTSSTSMAIHAHIADTCAVCSRNLIDNTVFVVVVVFMAIDDIKKYS